MWNFAADLKYGHYYWKCYGGGDRWYDSESIQPYTWKGGIRQTDGGPEPTCHPDHLSPIPPGGFHERKSHESTTYAGGVSVVGFPGDVTATIGKGTKATWTNNQRRERQLCGERQDIASDRPTRIRSLP
jgi:hypothetical protein